MCALDLIELKTKTQILYKFQTNGTLHITFGTYQLKLIKSIQQKNPLEQT